MAVDLSVHAYINMYYVNVNYIIYDGCVPYIVYVNIMIKSFTLSMCQSCSFLSDGG